MEPFVLDAYAARSCPVKTFHAFDPALSHANQPVDESLREQFQGGLEHRQKVLDRLVAATPGAVDLRGLTQKTDHQEQSETACLTALSQGARLVVGGALPPDVDGHRSGHPDALVRGTDSPSGSPGYWPLRVKPYRVRETQAGVETLLTSPIDAIERRVMLPGYRFRTRREGVLLELGHFWRLLEQTGFASADPLAAVVGTDGGTVPTATWVDLAGKHIRTYSRNAGYTLRSALERYDHEHRFRVHVAQQAITRGRSRGADPVVRPIRVKECDWCSWWPVCRPLIDDDDLSLRLSKTPLDVRELQSLMSLGITTVTQLAEADVEALLPRYLALTGHRDRPEQRLRQAARRARMLKAGVHLERVSRDPVGVPRSPVEVDLDIETAEDGSVYLWGVLITDGAGSRFKHFSRFAPLSESAETDLAVEFATWLLALVARHREVRVFHYSDYETIQLRRLAQRSGHPALTGVCALIREHFVDLFGYVRENYVGVDGLGLKAVATRGAGFTWRDKEPGGLACQGWFAEAVGSATSEARAAARKRVLQYNEDDVYATRAVREWLSAQDSGGAESG